MRKTATLILGLIILILSQACSVGGNSPSGNTSQAGSSTAAALTQRHTEVVPSTTPTQTKPLAFTPIDTPTRIATATAKASDLELMDIILDRSNGGIVLMGRIRNNTGRTVFLGGDDLGLQIRYTQWSQNDSRSYTHLILDPVKPKVESYHSAFTNCLLYPGETGIIAVPLTCDEKDGCHEIQETTLDPPPALGAFLEYSSQPHPVPDDPVDPGLHPKAENVQFLTKEDIFFLRFSTVFPGEDNGYFRFRALLLDRNGSILNVVAMRDYFRRPKSNILEIRGWSRISRGGVLGDWFSPFAPLTDEVLKNLDHIEVFVEYEYKNCSGS